MKTVLWSLLMGVAAATVSAAEDDTPDAFQRVVQPFLQQYCLACHGPEKQNAQLRYDRLDGFRAADRHLWTLIHEQLASGEMPPKDRPQPANAERQAILSWIAQQQRSLGGGGTRRLNRRELSAALQDVTGLSIDFAHALPGDGKVNGFDTGAEGLQDAADSVAQIMQVTRRAVDALRFLEASTGKTFAAELGDVKDARRAFDGWKDAGARPSTGDTANRPGSGLWMKPKWLGERGGMTIHVPPPAGRLGVLRLKVVVSAEKLIEGLPNPHLWVEVGGRDLAYLELTNPRDQPRTLTYEVSLSDVAIDMKGIAVNLSNRVEVPYAVEGFENDDKSKPDDNIPGGTGLFRPLYDRKSPPETQPVPFIVLHEIEIDPDYRAAWPPAEWEHDIGAISDDPQSAERLLALWMERAWRRPVTGAERERFQSFYAKLREDGLSFDDALRATFQAVLLSGSFRYLEAPGESADDANYDIASRLSFMLWGSPPDDELRQLAAAGKLHDPQVLDAQVERLLADERSRGFWEPFVTQWLEMEQPITIAMDFLQKQDFRFGRYLKASMKEETVAYVAQLFAENRPARELVDSDWTMMNNILAHHYGYDGIEDGRLRKVALRKDDPRGGGILGHAGIQSMLCWMGENWVIYRGAWTLRHILDDPPPPPPLEVPELIPSDGANHGKTFKELLRQHQADDRCAVCHKSIDPLGFAFQNFDLSGRWRKVEYDHYVTNDLDGKIEWRGAGATRPVDAAGTLPRGEKFESFAECKQLIVSNYLPDLVRGIAKNLVLYGTGRKADIDDLAEIRGIMENLEARGYPLQDLLKAIIRSKMFVRK